MILRTRTKGALTDGADWYHRNGTKYNLSNKLELQVGETQTTTDVVTPRYRQRVERGDIINNPFESWRISKSHSLSGPAFRNSTGSSTWDYAHSYWGVPGAYSVKWGVEFAAQLQEACTEARARIAKSSMDGIVEVGEGRETLELFRLRTWNLIRHLERERKYATRKGLGAVVAAGRLFRDNWLKYRFGILPALSLIEDAVIGPRIRTVRETSRGAGSVGGSEVLWNSAQADATFSETWLVTRSWSVSTRAGVLYQYMNGYPNAHGFTLADLPVSMYNLVPWTFVGEWFVNMNDFIRAYTPHVGISELASWSGFHSEVTLTATRTASSLVNTSLTLTRAPSGVCITHVEGKVRRNHCPGATLYVKPNAVRGVLSSARAVDALALASQLLFR